MTPIIDAVYQELLRRARQGEHGAQLEQWGEWYMERTGRVEADHPEAVARREAAWEDALCRGGLAAVIGRGLEDEAERQVARLIVQAQRGVFSIHHVGSVLLVQDLLRGAEFLMTPVDNVLRDIRGDNLGSLCQGRVLATEDGAVMLPGALFHEAEATESIIALISHARTSGMDVDSVCDCLTYMDYRFKAMSRGKASYAYRMEIFTTWSSRVSQQRPPWDFLSPRGSGQLA